MKYRVLFRIPFQYEVEAGNEEQAEKEAWKSFQFEQMPDIVDPEVEIQPLETE